MYSITFLHHSLTVSYVVPGNVSDTVIVSVLPHTCYYFLKNYSYIYRCMLRNLPFCVFILQT